MTHTIEVNGIKLYAFHGCLVEESKIGGHYTVNISITTDFSASFLSDELADTDKKDDDSEFLTETLAKIYIKQKKYDKALAIIKQLSLNYPKKSAYFADQIRFLEYLIINDKKNK